MQVPPYCSTMSIKWAMTIFSKFCSWSYAAKKEKIELFHFKSVISINTHLGPQSLGSDDITPKIGLVSSLNTTVSLTKPFLNELTTNFFSVLSVFMGPFWPNMLFCFFGSSCQLCGAIYTAKHIVL